MILGMGLAFFGYSALAAPLPAKTYQDLVARHSLKKEAQAFCYEDASGEIWGDRIDARVIPASVTKAYTTYVALKIYGPAFRFQTRVSIHPGETGLRVHFSGDHDGYFVSEQVFYVLNALSREGIEKIREVTFDASFYLNFQLDPAGVKNQLWRIFNPGQARTSVKAEYADFAARARALGLDVSPTLPPVTASSVRMTGRPADNPASELKLKSLPLIDLLKDMNVHSNNRFAKAVFVRLNDTAGFNRILREDLNTDETTLGFSDGSGGQANYTTCRASLRLFRALETLLGSHSFRLQDAISVGGMDGGTLKNRFLDDATSDAVLGKTGTLPDIGVSTLAGKISTASGDFYYGIFNRSGASGVSNARSLQDRLVEEVVRVHGGKKGLGHRPWKFEVLNSLN